MVVERRANSVMLFEPGKALRFHIARHDAVLRHASAFDETADERARHVSAADKPNGAEIHTSRLPASANGLHRFPHRILARSFAGPPRQGSSPACAASRSLLRERHGIALRCARVRPNAKHVGPLARRLLHDRRRGIVCILHILPDDEPPHLQPRIARGLELELVVHGARADAPREPVLVDTRGLSTPAPAACCRSRSLEP